MGLAHGRCPRKCPNGCSNLRGCGSQVAPAACSLDTLPDSVLLNNLLPRLSPGDKKSLRLASLRTCCLVNQAVGTVCVSAAALAKCPEGTTLGEPFPAARTFKALDGADIALTDEKIIRFLSDSDSWLHSLKEVNLKKCHYVTCGLLRFLRMSCPALRKLSPSRWTNPGALREIAGFDKLEELDLGDPDTDIITIDDLGLTYLTGLSGSLKRLGLSRCRWVSDLAFQTISRLSKLEVLDLSHTDVGPRGLAWLVHLPNLHTLNLTGCRNIDDDALIELSHLAPLTHLTLKGTMATNTGLKHLSTLPRLAHLDLGSKWEVDDAGLAAIAACPHLKVLAAGSFNLVRPPHKMANPKGLLKLEHLSFGGCFASKGLQALFPLLKLKSLYIQGIDSVTDHVMRHISTSQTQLQHLSLRSGYSLTTEGLQLLSSLANLCVLSLGACPAISRTTLEAFTAAHARLCVIEKACPLLADSGTALCALAPEPAMVLPVMPCMKLC